MRDKISYTSHKIERDWSVTSEDFLSCLFTSSTENRELKSVLQLKLKLPKIKQIFENKTTSQLFSPTTSSDSL